MRWIFILLIGFSALFIAGCAAVFSVKGLGLLFAGSATAVMTMAAALELGKLVAASFLYRYWRDLNIPLRIYLFSAVIVLIGITSLGIYGYLARAYETTHTSVVLLEGRIALLDSQIADAHRQIDAERGALGARSTVDTTLVDAQQKRLGELDAQLESSLARLAQRRAEAAAKLDRDIDLQKQQLADAGRVMDDAIAAEQGAIASLNERVAALDRAVDAYTKEGVAGLFKPDHVKKGQQLREQQRPERETIERELESRTAAIADHRAAHAAKTQAINTAIESLRTAAASAAASVDAEEKQLRQRHADDIASSRQQMDNLRADGSASAGTRQQRIDALYQQVRAQEDEIALLRQRIADTDVGTYRFVARSMGLPVDSVVKWLILVLVVVFDPLAVTLTVGFNVAVMRAGRGRRPAADPTSPGGADRPDAGPAGAPRWATALACLLVLGAVAAGAFAVTQYTRAIGVRAHATMIPADSFAVVTIYPDRLNDAAAHEAALSLGGLVPADTAAQLKALAIDGFATDRPIYLFAKHPHQPATDAAQREHPVLLVGMVAAIADPARAEQGLAAFAESVAGVLLPRQVDGARHSRAMIDHGDGRYLDPEGGFFSYAINDHAAVLMLEIEGDPSSACVDQEVRRCLETTAGGEAFGAKADPLPQRATSGRAAVSLWFDADRCFDRMPKNPAAQTRHDALKRFLAFDAVIEIEPVDTTSLRVTGDYRYAVKRFDPQRGRIDDPVEAMSQLGPSNDARVAGLLMDRCADTLEFESVIARLRRGLASAGPGAAPPRVVVDKFVDSETAARFELRVEYEGGVDSPLTAFMEHLGQ